MAMIFLSDEDRAGRRSVKVLSTIQGARTGRWCQAEAGAYPDRCDCILEDLTNGLATHFTIQYGTVNGVPARTLREMRPGVCPGAQTPSHSLTLRVRIAVESPARSSRPPISWAGDPTGDFEE
jgi:hypothetical protein